MIRKSYLRVILVITLSTMAIFLIGSNIVGLFKSLRNIETHKIPERNFSSHILLPYEDVMSISSRDYISTDQLIYNINHAVYNGIKYYWDDEGIAKYNLRVPFDENYILHFASYVYPKVFEKYEFVDFKKNLERGVGLCGTYSMIFAGLLEERKIKTKIVNLPGHVLTMVQINKEKNIWYLVDPTHDIIINKDLKYIIKNPGIIKSYYTHNWHEEQFNNIVSVEDYSSLAYHGILKYSIEKMSYWLIWIFPSILLIMAYWIWRDRKPKKRDYNV